MANDTLPIIKSGRPGENAWIFYSVSKQNKKNKTKKKLLSSAKVLINSSRFRLRAPPVLHRSARWIYVRGANAKRNRRGGEKKKVICSSSRAFGISPYIQTADVCVRPHQRRGDATTDHLNMRRVRSAAYHESCHWFRDHNDSQASHSVMEIWHLIETYLCGSYSDTSYTQFEPFDVLWILQMDPELISGKVSIPRCRGKGL